MSAIRLDELARRFELELKGDGSTPISGVCTLQPGQAGHLGFLSNPKLRAQLGSTAAAAAIVGPRDAQNLPGAGLVARDPYLAFARIAKLFDPDRAFDPGVHPSAVVHDTAVLGDGVHIGPNAVIERGATIGANSFVGPACVVGRDAVLGPGCRLVAQVHVGARVAIGARCQFQPGAIIGARGFGNARGPDGWEEVPQLGRVLIGDDVEIGAGTCVDRGALEDTIIERGVRLDNLIMVAHNCHIGEHTAIAACTGIAGSTRIGARCMIAGAVGIGGHLHIGDDVVILGMAMVTKSLPDKGVYGSGVPIAEARQWRKQVARYRRLGQTELRLREVESRLGIDSKAGEQGEEGGDE